MLLSCTVLKTRWRPPPLSNQSSLMTACARSTSSRRALIPFCPKIMAHVPLGELQAAGCTRAGLACCGRACPARAMRSKPTDAPALCVQLLAGDFAALCPVLCPRALTLMLHWMYSFMCAYCAVFYLERYLLWGAMWCYLLTHVRSLRWLPAAQDHVALHCTAWFANSVS